MLHTVIAAVLVAVQPVQSIDSLAWLSGTWRASEAQGGGYTEELWTPAEAGAMFGISRTVAGSATRWFEYTRIVVEPGGTLVFIAQPGGAAPARFTAVSRGEAEIVFANAAHDYPQRISYRREGDVLTATIALMDGSRPNRWTYRLQPR